ncbi:protocadherin beta-1-like [Stegastes partitus]|uniref:Protocadherin beta-1-like n=1 Tax=Stegastes partitus TaxID=144197 RepID=A0A9Y4NV71_9TELE|nr:PREDICTED: protocadherin beta-1-like [Stegastes partitus]
MPRAGLLFFLSVVSLRSVCGQVSYSIPEEMAKGSLVGNIAQDLGLDVKRLKSGKARIYTGEGTDHIELNKERGALVIKERIDREALCGQTTPCALDFQIILENPMQFYSVTVEITDINDNSPTFKNSEMKFDISETVQIGSKFVLEKAVDDDVGVNGLQGYSLSSSDMFTLNPYRIGSSRNVEMVLRKPLDREKQDHVSVVLTALDGGNPQLSGTIQIAITVLDANDNAPVCSQAEFKTNVNENSIKGALLTTVSASDADEGPHGKIRYSISNGPKGASELFNIDEDSGVFTLVGKLDYEKFRHYEIDVQASDEGGNADVCKVIIEVLDTNDNPPAINIMSALSSISEDVKPGTVLTMMNVQDPDSNENGKVHCVLDDHVHFKISSTSNNFFSLVTDRILHGLFYTTMAVTTMRRQVLAFISFLCFCSVTGQVSYSIPEEMPKGSFVGDIAQDLGLDVKRLKSGKARIYTGDSAEYIELNKERGVLLVKDRIDREVICAQTAPCALHFQVILENPMEFYSITVEVTDVNDNAPIFERGEMKFRISESAVVGTVFVLEQAIDLDVGVNGLQSYLLKPTDNFVLKLQNQADGSKMVEMVLQKPLDREKQDHLSLVLTAIDGGEPQLSGAVQISVNVLDSNDNAPVFTQKIYKSTLRENSPPGTIVITVSATDLDEGSNGKISYVILNSVDDASEIFDINGETGEVKLVGSTDFEKKRQYQIHVQASDEGGLTDSSKVIVEILDTNDNVPVINVMSKSSLIAEDVQPGTVVTIVNIQDADSGTMQRMQSEKSILDEPDSPLEVRVFDIYNPN